MPRTRTATLEQRVDERCDGARLREDDQQAKEHEHDHNRHQPVLFLVAEELEELGEDAALAHLNLKTSGGSDSDRGTSQDRSSNPATKHAGAAAGRCRMRARAEKSARTPARTS